MVRVTEDSCNCAPYAAIHNLMLSETTCCDTLQHPVIHKERTVHAVRLRGKHDSEKGCQYRSNPFDQGQLATVLYRFPTPPQLVGATPAF